MSSDKLPTRDKILKASLYLLETGNGDGVRMGDIAKRAGISRQALYLHFATRAELLVAVTHYLDKLHGTDQRLAASRAAKSGVERLDAYIDAWGNFIPEIYGVAKALLAMRDRDEAAAEAWDARMQDVRHGCAAAITALRDDGMLSEDYSQTRAIDILWTMLSVRNWQQLTIQCGWSQKEYITHMKSLARKVFVKA